MLDPGGAMVCKTDSHDHDNPANWEFSLPFYD